MEMMRQKKEEVICLSCTDSTPSLVPSPLDHTSEVSSSVSPPSSSPHPFSNELKRDRSSANVNQGCSVDFNGIILIMPAENLVLGHHWKAIRNILARQFMGGIDNL